MSIRVLIVDDHGVLRAGLRMLIGAEADMKVVGEAADGRTALELTGELTPDVVLLDISLPDMSGIQVTRKLKQVVPDCRILILTLHQDVGLLREAIEAGAAGYIIKQAAETELLVAIRAVMRGELYVHSALAGPLFQDASASPPSSMDRLQVLTPRELEVFRLLARGFTNRQIAEELSISVRTAEGHRANVMGKLGLHHRAELMSVAEQFGLLD